MTVPSLREKLTDSLVQSLEAIGTDPSDNYWFDFNVDRYSILGQQSVPPRIQVTTRGGDAQPRSVGMMTASLGFEMLVEMTHDLRQFPGYPPETETDKLLERAVSDVQRAFLRWVELDPLGYSPVLESFAWDREDPLTGRLEVGAMIFATIGYAHSGIDPRTQVYDPKELTT